MPNTHNSKKRHLLLYLFFKTNMHSNSFLYEICQQSMILKGETWRDNIPRRIFYPKPAFNCLAVTSANSYGPSLLNRSTTQQSINEKAVGSYRGRGI
jgi:hypothetical protein